MGYFQESAGLGRDSEGFQRGSQITEGNEGESVQAAIMDAVTESAEATAEIEDMETRGDDESEVVADLTEATDAAQATTNEHGGLTAVEAKLVSKIYASVVGKKYADRKVPQMESFASRSDSSSNTGYVAESVSETLKRFWEILKEKFKSAWNKLKAAYTKWFSTARKIAERAKQVRDRANSMSTTIDTKTFEFSQGKLLHIDGKLRDGNNLITSLKNVQNIVEKTHQVSSKNDGDKLVANIDAGILGNTEPKTKFGLAVLAVLGGVETAFSFLDESKASNIDTEIKNGFTGGSSDIKIKASDKLPGDRALLMAINESDQPVEKMRSFRVAFVNLKKSPRDVSNISVSTLNTSQIGSICDVIESSAGDIYECEKNVQIQDKNREKLTRELDNIAKEIEDDNKSDMDDDTKDSNEINNKRRKFRTLTTTLTNYMNRVDGYSAVIANYALPVYAAALNLCEASMKNHKN